MNCALVKRACINAASQITLSPNTTVATTSQANNLNLSLPIPRTRTVPQPSLDAQLGEESQLAERTHSPSQTGI